MSINHDSQDSYDRFFPPAQDNTGGQPAVGPKGHTWPRHGADPGGGNQQPPTGGQPAVDQRQRSGETGGYGGDPRAADQRQLHRLPPPAGPYNSPPLPPPPGERSYSQPAAAPTPPVAEPAQPSEQPAAGEAPANPREQFWTATNDQSSGRPAPQQAWPDAANRAAPAARGDEAARPAAPVWPDEAGRAHAPVQQQPWVDEATTVVPRGWVARQPQQPTYQPPPQSEQPEWMSEPYDARYVDQRVGDDEKSLTFSADRLDLVGKRKLPPGRGWRKWLYRLSFHSINLGLSPAEVAYAEMVETIRQPIRGDYKIGVVSLKGGVGKTTSTVTLGSVFAQHRKGDRVVALDGNPDFGNLISRVPRQTNTTVKDLLADADLSRYGDVRHHTSQNIHGLEVVAGERDLAQSERFSKSEYERVMAVLQSHYSLIFTDCGTGLINEAMAGVLDTANALILVSSVTVDGARAASANIEWLLIHGHHHLVQRAVVILNQNKQGKTSANIDQLKEHFSPHVRAVHVIPFDEHLAEGGAVNLGLLSKKTLRAFEELAELIATDFPNATGKHTAEAQARPEVQARPTAP
ncbi:AAA family ATPase [Mycobacterium hubeiense]|uniref:nucleotide-binding protein n=1 Tax=Mycobacterium hubeiense TaxID=1867256 RepID=UPI000C7EB8BC|nr:AAA family ATPase [Mycobacterium sp. QGD 101]